MMADGSGFDRLLTCLYAHVDAHVGVHVLNVCLSYTMVVYDIVYYTSDLRLG